MRLVFSFFISMLVIVTNLVISQKAQAKSWTPESATYEVPTDPLLASLANFEMKDIKTRVRNGTTEIQYMLPRELTGDAVSIHLTSTTENPGNLMGKLGQARCAGADCQMLYPRLTLDPNRVHLYLESQGYTGTELTNREKVAEAFRNTNPAGIIHFRR